MDIELVKLVDRKNNDVQTKNVYVALNLFSLSNISYFVALKNVNVVFWIDGTAGAFFLKLKGIKIKKTPGVEFLQHWLKNQNENMIVLGDLSPKEQIELEKYGSVVGKHYPLENFELSHLFKVELPKDHNIIITLPSPKQELAACNLYKNFPNCNFVCVGGAVNMIGNYSLNAPFWVRRIGMEWAFRLKSDTKRRLVRLFVSFFNLVKVFPTLTKTKWEIFQK
jgi:UDP-N-acetyl-D-mannosaminuronic acid transferase (WecB/TagA/CpsF family)